MLSLDLTESAFERLLMQVFSEIDEAECMDIYDLLECEGAGSISFREFYVLLLFQAAGESDQLLRCLFLHGNLLYTVLSGNQTYISGTRIQEMVRVMGS